MKETLRKELMIAGLDSMRGLGGDELVEILLRQPGMPDFRNPDMIPDRVPIEDFLRYRDAAMEFFQDAFAMTAFQTGQLMVARMENAKEGKDIARLLEQFRLSANPLAALGQAAVLAAAGNPGTVRARMNGDTLVLTIEGCPECRGLRLESPICYFNQGVTTEFARRFLNLQVIIEEVRCTALGDPCCEFHVTRAGGA